MIFKSYEIHQKKNNLTKYNLYLLYGENFGLKKDIREFIKKLIKENDSNIEILSFYEINKQLAVRDIAKIMSTEWDTK